MSLSEGPKEVSPELEAAIDKAVEKLAQDAKALLMKYAKGEITRSDAEKKLPSIAGHIGIGLNEVDVLG